MAYQKVDLYGVMIREPEIEQFHMNGICFTVFYRSYAETHNITELNEPPPKVREEDVNMSVSYDPSDNYMPVITVSWTYPLCRDGGKVLGVQEDMYL